MSCGRSDIPGRTCMANMGYTILDLTQPILYYQNSELRFKNLTLIYLVNFPQSSISILCHRPVLFLPLSYFVNSFQPSRFLLRPSRSASMLTSVLNLGHY